MLAHCQLSSLKQCVIVLACLIVSAGAYLSNSGLLRNADFSLANVIMAHQSLHGRQQLMWSSHRIKLACRISIDSCTSTDVIKSLAVRLWLNFLACRNTTEILNVRCVFGVFWICVPAAETDLHLFFISSPQRLQPAVDKKTQTICGDACALSSVKFWDGKWYYFIWLFDAEFRCMLIYLTPTLETPTYSWQMWQRYNSG